MNIYTELTPNPQSIKFVIDEAVKSFPATDFQTAAQAQGSGLAEHLFVLSYVTGVYFGTDRLRRSFVTISKQENTRWEDVIQEIKQIIGDYLATDQAVVTLENIHASSVLETDDAVVIEIKKLIDNEIRPAVAGDGGDITFEGFEDGVVKVLLKGSCSGCPSSTITLRNGIEALLTRMVPQVKSVEAING